MESLSYLDARGLVEALQSARLPGALAFLLGHGLDEASAERGAWLDERALLARLPAWVGRAACLRPARGGPELVYLEPRAGQASGFPSSVVIRMETGRYAVRTWDPGLGAYAGSEVASASPLVCGPPCSGGSVFLEIERIG